MPNCALDPVNRVRRGSRCSSSRRHPHLSRHVASNDPFWLLRALFPAFHLYHNGIKLRLVTLSKTYRAWWYD
ncbi:hypothetical protein E2C01_026056 [Portunus trituberculatus]|uniref:Uncharacterized protein n=1 Tax=Portunus trituberculatus TaxID=210409 RepID=A0A5B7EHM6_PORTR|nr:hypothetical protein [Portunus trituberculatus]